MDKILTFETQNTQGIFLYTLGQGRDQSYLEKTASANFHPQIADYISNVKSVPGTIQVLLTALGAGEHWGCFLQGAPVLMADGRHLPIEEVQKGDLVISHTGRPCAVLEPLDKYYSGLLYSFKLHSWGPSITCTQEHPFYGIKREDLTHARKAYYKQKETEEQFIRKLQYSFIKASELSPGDYFCIPFSKLEKESEELSKEGLDFLLGTYLAEGTLVKRYSKPGQPYHKVIYTLGGHEGWKAEKIKEICRKSFNASALITEKYQGNNAIRVEVTSAELAYLCLNHIGRFSKNKTLSSTVMDMPKSWLIEFLSAYLDGDGCQVKTKGRYQGAIRSSTASVELAAAICKVVAKLGFRASFFKCKQHETSGFNPGGEIYENSYERSFSDVLNVARFEKVQGKTCSMSAYLDQERGYILVPIKSITEDGYEGVVFNLHVEEDNSYCVNNIAVHNSNVNGDFFPASSLKNEGPDYGHKTFEMYAHVYKHHINKDPLKSYGKVLLSVWNERMKRVELIVTLEEAKAPDLVERINNGEYPEVSMGTRVPYDVCSICGNKAAQRAQYCDHLRYHMNKIPPGHTRKAYAINTLPKFFDISFVLIGADRIAKVMKKVAHEKGVHTVSSAEAAEIVKTASNLGKELRRSFAENDVFVKTAFGLTPTKVAAKKIAEIEKEVPSNLDGTTVGKVLETSQEGGEVLHDLEPEIDRKIIIRISTPGSGYSGLSKILSTLSMMGIMPKRQEFQDMTLRCLGQENLADEYHRLGLVFPSSLDGCSAHCDPRLQMGAESFDNSIFSALRPFIADRSYARPHLNARIIRLVKLAESGELKIPQQVKVASEEDSNKIGLLPMMAMLTGLYMAVTKKAPAATLTGIDKVFMENPGFAVALGSLGVGAVAGMNALTGRRVAGKFDYNPDKTPTAPMSWQEELQYKNMNPLHKTAQNKEASTGAGSIAKRLFIGVPALYMGSGLQEVKRARNPQDQEGALGGFIRKHPDVASALLVGEGLAGFPVTSKIKNVLKSGLPFLRKTASLSDDLTGAAVFSLAFPGTSVANRLLSSAVDQGIISGVEKLIKLRNKQNHITRRT